MCQAIADMMKEAEDKGILEGETRGKIEGKIEGKMICYLNAVSRGLSREDAIAIADITEKEAETACSLRKEGKL